MLLVLLSCSSRQDEYAGAELIRFGKRASEENLTIKYERLDVPDSLFIGTVEQFGCDEDYIYLLNILSDNAGVYVFDKQTGIFETKVGHRGRGTGEYILPLSFTLSDSSLFIVDGGAGKVLEYAKSGFGYVGQKKAFDMAFFETASDSSMICDNPVYNRNGDFRDKAFVRSDPDFNICAGYVEKPVISGYATGPVKPMYRFGTRVRAYTQHIPAIFEFSDDSFHPVYRLSFDGLEFPPKNFLQKISRGERDYTRDLRESGYISYYDFFETENSLLSFCMAGEKRYLGIKSKLSDESYLFDEASLNRLSPYSPVSIAGVKDNAFVIVMPADELKMSEIVPLKLRKLLYLCDDTDLILQLIEVNKP